MSEIFPVIVSPAVYFMLVRFSFKTVSVWNQERGDWRYDRQSLVHISDINLKKHVHFSMGRLGKSLEEKRKFMKKNTVHEKYRKTSKIRLVK